jgi:hypothetical protein
MPLMASLTCFSSVIIARASCAQQQMDYVLARMLVPTLTLRAWLLHHNLYVAKVSLPILRTIKKNKSP